ncbi:MAG: mechanosensitive ion channel protein MscS [Neptuniibacter caesariensis]|uniref:Small-conductance mechanosensitive channel n=1 Tax=Neptuniibacter caesariensis TaxID=207954 RepID=A0A2G6JPA7_NEPCE|nr:MAG: mechanosensitive ion channel protein MscS [Neptuniibacter caesariensis]
MENFLDVYVLPWVINIALALAIFIVGRWIVKQVMKVVERLLRRANLDDMLINFVTSIANVVLLLFIIVAALNQLGVDTTSLIALVGAAGLAIGLSLQDSLKNFAAGVMLIIFKPFREGDLVEAAGVLGVIEHIQIFNSIMRTADNKEIIVPNGAIYGGVIINYSARDTRRVDMVFGIGYDDDLRKAKEILNEIIAADERILKDPAPVVAVSELADSSVNFVVRPWVNSADYWPVMWDITETVKLRFDEEGISIPYPQMDVHLHKQDNAV